MPIHLRLTTDLTGAAALHVGTWLADELSALPDVLLTDTDPELELFVGGRLILPGGYDQPAFMLLGTVVRHYRVARLAEELRDEADYPALLATLPLLDAPEYAAFVAHGGPPVDTRRQCKALVKRVDELALEPVRKARQQS